MILTPQELPWTLASASPRRLRLLRQVGIEPRVIPADIDEENGGSPPERAALENARRKAVAVRDRVENGILLAADTVVILDGESLGKPVDAAEAERMLARLSGRTHEVITAFSLLWVERGLEMEDSERTQVKMRTLPTCEIERYVATGEPFDKAGAYGIQGAAAAFVERVEGCYFNVVGLPISRILGHVSRWVGEYVEDQRGA
ncbi:MAG: Maf family protein [bacterium]